MKMRLIKPNYLKAIVTLFGIAIIPAFRLTTLPSVIEAKVIAEESELERAALEVLQTKCNVCHTRKNPRRVFTSKNISELAPKIYQQVFIKRRMPKGKEVKLTTTEYAVLEKWLFTQDIF
tara:strand:- start:326 stop:685 length:360 start_codon:yes stop_codon:yes gene_type:complete